jgi:hypothetical protein
MDAPSMALTEVGFLLHFSVVAAKQVVNLADKKAAMAGKAAAWPRQPVIIVNGC